jgi:hypothetical protein
MVRTHRSGESATRQIVALHPDEDDIMSKSAKKRALRLFLYLGSVGHTPDLRAANYYELAARLSKEYDELPLDVRRNSRSLGRKIIQASGLRAAYQSGPGVTPFNPVMNPRAKCSICRVKKSNKPKSVWSTKEDAEEFCRHFGRFAPYPCPAGNGWHVAHRRRQRVSQPT